jgi:hypothetical protein
MKILSPEYIASDIISCYNENEINHIIDVLMKAKESMSRESKGQGIFSWEEKDEYDQDKKEKLVGRTR